MRIKFSFPQNLAVPSNRSAEETSESTGTRSESSTPIQRSNAYQSTAAYFSPMPAATKCKLCDINVINQYFLLFIYF